MAMDVRVENLRRIQANVKRAKDAGWSREQIDAYVQQEGYSPDQYRSASRNLAALGGAKPADVGFGGRAASSALFNFGDEALGAIRAYGLDKLPGMGGAVAGLANQAFAGGRPTGTGNYQGEVAAARMGLDEYARQNPGMALAADVTGALVPAAATFGASMAPTTALRGAQGIAAARAATTVPQATGLMTRAARAGAVGAAEGGVAGFGAGEGGAREQAFSTLQGAGLGLGFGAGLPVLARGGQAVGDVVGNSGVGRGVRNAASSLTGGFVRDADTAAADRARREGLERFNRWLGEGELSLENLQDEVARLEALGIDDTVLADVAGPAFRSLQRGAANKSATTRTNVEDALNQRAARQGERVRDVLGEATGVRPSPQFAARANEWQTALNAEADPLLNTIRGGVDNIGDDPVMQEIFSRPQAQAYLNRLMQSSEAGNAPIRNQGWVEVEDAAGDALNENQKRLVLSPDTAERVRRFIGEDTQAATAASGGKPPAGQEYTDQLYGALRNRMGEMFPDYAQGLDLRRAGNEFVEASEAGFQFPNIDPFAREAALRQLREQQARGSTAPQAFREGYMGQLDERIAARERAGGAAGGRIDQAVPAISDMVTMRSLGQVFPDMDAVAQQRLGEQLAALTRQSQTRNAFLGGMNRISVLDPADPAFTAGQATSAVQQANLAPWISDQVAKAFREGKSTRELEAIGALSEDWMRTGSRQINPFFDELARQRVATEAAGARGGAAGAAAGGAMGIVGPEKTAPDTAIGLERADVERGIQQRERLLADPNTPANERARLEMQVARLRQML